MSEESTIILSSDDTFEFKATPTYLDFIPTPVHTILQVKPKPSPSYKLLYSTMGVTIAIVLAILLLLCRWREQ